MFKKNIYIRSEDSVILIIIHNNEPAVTHKQKRILHIPTNTSAIGISDDEQQRHNLHVLIEGLFVHRIFRENSVILNRFINSHC